MTKHIVRNISLATILVMGIIVTGLAQGYELVTQKNVMSYENKSYYATQEVVLKPGFSFSASSGTGFFAKISIYTGQSPSGDRNYLRTDEILVGEILNESQISALPSEEKTTVYDYTDGLGRTSQTVTVQGSPSKNDIVEPNEYDQYGRQKKQYLPFSSASDVAGKYIANGSDVQHAFYQAAPAGVVSDDRPFTEDFFEASPLSRVIQRFGPGLAWNDGTTSKSITSLTKLNADQEVVNWNEYVSGFPDKSSVNNGFYPANTLLVEETKDENVKINKIYKNLQGQVILNRVGDGTTWFDVYYIYSPAGLVMFVVQPEGVSRFATEYFAGGADKQSFLDRWAFQYQYDDEQRVTAKRVPGENGWTYIVYDKWNRVVLTQDADQDARDEYSFTKYDRFNRPIITGLYTTSALLPALRTSVANSTVRFENEPPVPAPASIDYTLNLTFPTTVSESDVLTKTYYDNYNFLSIPSWDNESNSFAFTNLTGYPQSTALTTSVKGMVTGTKVRKLDNTGSTWLNSVTHYDKKYNPVQVVSENHLGGVIRTTTRFDFAGKIEKENQYTSFSSLTIENVYGYDHAGRLTTHHQQVNSQTPVLMVSNTYNEIGQLVEKNIHSTDNGSTFLQSMDFRYNVRGWLTHLNNSSLNAEPEDDNGDLFGMEIIYCANTLPVVSTPSFTPKSLYDGNISFIKWKTDTRQGTPAIEKIYAFDYDVLSRMKEAVYATNTGTVALPNWSGDAGMFDEKINSYDKNGNVGSLVRQGNVQGSRAAIDNLAYTYKIGPTGKESNQLIAMEDTGNSLGFKSASASVTEEYKYDNNGRLKFDHNKQISSISYNHLNLVKKIQFTTPSVNEIEYIYDAAGTKLSTIIKVNGNQVWKTDYAGGIQYDNGQLSFFGTSDGRVVNNNGTFQYEYFLKDHQVNVRSVYGPLKETISYRATMESPTAVSSKEEVDFKNIVSTRAAEGVFKFNYTKSSNQVLAPDKAAECNGFTGKSVGPAKSLRVLTGDKVYMETYATYNQITGSTATVLGSTLLTAMTSPFNIVNSGETATLYQSFNTNLPGISSGMAASTTVPKAYLVWIFFNDSYAYVNSGAHAITTNAYNAFEKLSRSFTAGQNGYLYIYVANESNVNAGVNVYFDETYIVHEKNNATLQVIQASDYYPFGLSYNEFNTDRLKETTSGVYAPELRNRYKFQGQEEQRDLDLGWYQFEARMFDPTLGRWNCVDPLAKDYLSQTPYNFVLNNPIIYVDPDGRSVGPWPSYYVAPNSIPGPDAAIQSYGRQQIIAQMTPAQLGLEEAKAQQSREMTNNAIRQGGRQVSNQTSGGIPIGEKGSFMQMFTAGVAAMIPVIPGVAKGLINAREGNYKAAAVNFATAAADAYLLSPGKTSLGKVATYSESMAATEGVSALSGLKPTHYIMNPKAQMKTLVSDIKANGIVEPIQYVQESGMKYIVGGNHRFFAAQKLGIAQVPVQQVQLPFAGYITSQDLILTSKQPVWWQYFKP